MKSTLSRAAALASTLALAMPASAATPPHPSEAVCAGQDAGPDPSTRSNAMVGAGIGLTVTGAIVTTLVGVPALLLRRSARADADRATYEARQRRYARRADRREVVAVAALGTGGVMMLVGIPLLIAGARAKHGDRASVTPMLTPTMAGMNAALRF
ncbi:MAG: hypothetical protein ACE37F_04470 [Nannocystaceae bacterium]|nr:hypothetical protein [bacterium]